MDEIPETYEELKKWLSEECHMEIKDHPKQLLDLTSYPYWRCTNWEELSEAMSNCSVPTIGTAMFNDGLVFVEIYDNFIHNNAYYRWDLPEEKEDAELIE